MAKRDPLPNNPLDVEQEALRSMVRNENKTDATPAPATSVNTAPPRSAFSNYIDATPATATLVTTAPPPDDKPLNRTGVYLTLEEAEALRLRAFQERRTKTDIIRTAIREYLGIN